MRTILSYIAALRLSGVSLRFYLCALVAVILVPAFVLSGWLASRSAAAQRAQLEESLEEKTHEIVSAVDREIGSVIGMLTALASSHYLTVRDFEAFHRQATDVAGQLGCSARSSRT